MSAAEWVHQRSVANRALVVALQRDLDPGEAESIALALELNADLVLLDEYEGRRAAQRLGLRVVGVLGVLLEAKHRRMLMTIRPHLDALRQTAGFYLGDAVYERALALADEQ